MEHGFESRRGYKEVEVKVLFLDIDGVMNNRKTAPESCTRNRFDALPTHLLWKILNRTGAKVVIISAWRKRLSLDQLRQVFLSHNLQDRLIGVTGELGQMSPDRRGREITEWLNGRAEPVEGYAILDDADDMGEHIHRLVQTSWETGLTQIEADKVIALLK